MSKHNFKMIFEVGFIFGLFLQIEGQNISVSLAGPGSTSSQGRVEITYNGITGTVCDDSFDDQDAAVVCRQLGFPNGGTPTNQFGAGTGPIWLDDVSCQGNEAGIDDCISRKWNNSNCGHDEDIGVICNIAPPSSTGSPGTTRAPPVVLPSNCSVPSSNIRLIGPSGVIGIGFVEVRRNGVWGSICDDNWGTMDAKVICRMLCYDPTIAQAGAPSDINYAAENVSRTILLDDVECVGTETDIDQCPKSAWGVHNCDASKREFASVTCVKLENAQPEAPVPELECPAGSGKFYARFSRIRDPNLEEKHLTIFFPYNGPCQSSFVKTTNTITYIIPHTQCGTAKRITPTQIEYTNSIRYDYTLKQNQIVRVNTYRIDITCIFNRTIDDLDKGVTPLTETVTAKAPGRFIITLNFYNDSFNTALGGSIELTLGEWLHVALILESIDPDLKLIVPNCKATPTNDPNDPTIFDLFKDKCPTDPTLGFFPQNTTMFGFRYQTFKFVDYANVVLQCDAFICLVSEKNAECDRTCDTSNSTSTNSTTTDDTANTRRKREASQKQIYRVISPPLSFMSRDDGVVIDRGDGWEVTQVTPNGRTTMSMTTTVPLTTTTTQSITTSPSAQSPQTTTKVTSVLSSKSSSVTTKLTPVPSSSTIPTGTTKVTQAPTSSPAFTPASSSSTKHVAASDSSPTTQKVLTSHSKQDTTLNPTTSTVTPTAKVYTSSKNPTLRQTFTSKPTIFSTVRGQTSSSTHAQTQKPTMQPNFDPNRPYVGGLGGQISILSHASSLYLSFYTKIICIITFILCTMLR